MRQIIDGKLYDTDTATELASWANTYNGGDFHSCEESLHRTKKGKFFLYGESGALGKYSVAVGNNGSGGGSALVPLTDDAAREWAESKIDADEYIAIFGAPAAA